MALGNCNKEVQDCDLGQMGFEQLFRKLLRNSGGCLNIATNTLGDYKASEISHAFLEATSVANLNTAFNTWKTSNPNAFILDLEYNAHAGGGNNTSLLIVYKN
jgi:hypothetical protein